MDTLVVAEDEVVKDNQSEETSKKPKRAKNDIRDIRSFKMLDRVELDLDSPRFN